MSGLPQRPRIPWRSIVETGRVGGWLGRVSLTESITQPCPLRRNRPCPPGLLADLTAALGAENVLHHRDELLVYECDGYVIEKQVPDVVVLPTSTAQVVEIVRLCNAYEIPFVREGAGTSLAGGTLAVGGGVMICLTRMKRILEINTRDRYAIVEPGVVNLWLTRALAGTGFHYAPDPSSQSACTIGGNVATNSGGPHTLKYGVTVNHVRGVELVLPDGSIVETGGVTEDNPGYDLTGLIVGNEGTFGVTTRVIVGLTRDPEAGRTLLGVFAGVDDATETVSSIIAAGIVPAALEMLDNLMIRAIEQAFHFGFPTEAGAVLIIEVDGLDAGLDREAQAISEIVRSHSGSVQKSIAWRTRKEPEYVAIWKSRKSAFGAIGRLSPTFCTQDGVVPRTKLPHNFSVTSPGWASRHGIRIANVFHAGDGNIYIRCSSSTSRDPEQVKRVLQASHEILGRMHRRRRQRDRRARDWGREDGVHAQAVFAGGSRGDGRASHHVQPRGKVQPVQVAAWRCRLHRAQESRAPGLGLTVMPALGSFRSERLSSRGRGRRGRHGFFERFEIRDQVRKVGGCEPLGQAGRHERDVAPFPRLDVVLGDPDPLGLGVLDLEALCRVALDDPCEHTPVSNGEHHRLVTR